MASITAALGPLFLLILLGAVLGVGRIPGGDFWARMERLIYFLLFPAMLLDFDAGTHRLNHAGANFLNFTVRVWIL